MYRLQGAEWYSRKDELELIGYQVSNNHHYRAILRLKNCKPQLSDIRYCHWLNPDEQKRFEESEFFKTHEPLPQKKIFEFNRVSQQQEIRHLLERQAKIAHTINKLSREFDSIQDELSKYRSRTVYSVSEEMRREKENRDEANQIS